MLLKNLQIVLSNLLIYFLFLWFVVTWPLKLRKAYPVKTLFNELRLTAQNISEEWRCPFNMYSWVQYQLLRQGGWNMTKMFVQYMYTKGFRKTRHMLTLHVLMVHKMSGSRRRDEDNWTSTDPACCWLDWGQSLTCVQGTVVWCAVKWDRKTERICVDLLRTGGRVYNW
jgi:hypothetical protein